MLTKDSFLTFERTVDGRSELTVVAVQRGNTIFTTIPLLWETKVTEDLVKRPINILVWQIYAVKPVYTITKRFSRLPSLFPTIGFVISLRIHDTNNVEY